MFVCLLHFNDGRPSRRTRQQSTIYKVRRHVQDYGAAEPSLVVSRVCDSHKNKPTAVQLAPDSFLGLELVAARPGLSACAERLSH